GSVHRASSWATRKDESDEKTDGCVLGLQHLSARLHEQQQRAETETRPDAQPVARTDADPRNAAKGRCGKGQRQDAAAVIHIRLYGDLSCLSVASLIRTKGRIQ